MDAVEPVDRTPDAAQWDERYGAAPQVWSGEPNGALVAEVAHLEPGRALDVGCGEGADAVWLARRGWDVTALDVSRVALDRAERHAVDAGVHVTWLHAGLLEAGLPAGAFDLVTAQYPVLRRSPTAVAERTLLDLVAPGGTLLVVHHALDAHHAAGPAHAPDAAHAPGPDRAPDAAHVHDTGPAPAPDAPRHADDSASTHQSGFDPAEYVLPADVAAVLDGRWRVEVDERRPRSISGGAGAHHVDDVVLRARRL